MNPFEDGSRKCIPAVLVYVREGVDVLMLHRVTKNGDEHFGKWNGLGGKLEADESPWAGAVREVREEAGLSLDEADLSLLGVLQFPNFKPQKSEDWLVWVFSARLKGRVPLGACAEGHLKWINEAEVTSLPLWDGDAFFLPHMLRGEKFFGTFWYENGRLARHDIRS